MNTIPTEHDDPINAKILSVSEDLVSGFQQDPFSVIAEQSSVDLETVLERIRAMLEAGVIRRVRQTMLATKLAHGALVAKSWTLPMILLRRCRYAGVRSRRALGKPRQVCDIFHKN